jgi:prolipoprotein diacylglyceryltransferase
MTHMTNLIFIAVLALLLGLSCAWGFTRLSAERWQILGCIPLRKLPDGCWQGLNLTYYGLLNANAVVLSALIVWVLLGAAGLPLNMILGITLGLVIVFAPAAKLIAMWVEKRKDTFSIGGVSFAGFMLAPLLLLALRAFLETGGETRLPVMNVMAAAAVAYALGEGIGRLACISFGCCYGKPLNQMPARLRRLLAPLCIVYHGRTKKAAYAQGLDGEKTLAVPCMTAVIFCTAGLAGVYLFLEGSPPAAYLLCVLATQIWRFFSEFLRADYRGGGRVSAYQYMALLAALVSTGYYLVLPADVMPVDLATGLRNLWNPAIIFACIGLWIAIFLYMGRSRVTTAHISLFVRPEHN